MSLDEAPRAQRAAQATPARSIVVANAGSGKTWTLANRILAWCMDEVRAGREPAPSRILAVTFTRKAAGEILARILVHAASAARDDESGAKARALFEPLVGAATREQYATVLDALTRELHRMQVGTLDGFFHRMASALPDEVGLAGEWTIGEDREVLELRVQAAERVLESDGAADLVTLLEAGAPKPTVLAAVSELLGGTTTSVLDLYRSVANFGDHAVDRAWRWLERIPVGDDVKGSRGKENLERVLDRLRALPPAATRGKKGAAGPPHKLWASGCTQIHDCLDRGDLRGLAEVKMLAKLLDEGRYARVTIPDDWAEVLGLLKPHLAYAFLREALGRTEGALAVLPAADAALRDLQEESGIYGFGDIAMGVARAASTPGTRASDARSLAAALGRAIADLAIDEAQDTSPEQFAAMRPLIESVLGAGDGGVRAAGHFLLVGDPKQSIYGWRGGTPGLIAEIETRYRALLDEDLPLTKSFRSSPILMDFVNRVFADLPGDLPALVGDAGHIAPLTDVEDFVRAEGLDDTATQSAFVRAAREWRFDRHESANRALAGWIKVYACGKPSKGSSGGTAAGGAGGDDESAAPETQARSAASEAQARSDEHGLSNADAAGTAIAGAASASGTASASGAIVGAGVASGDSPSAPRASVDSEPVSTAERAAAVAAMLHRAHPTRSIGVLVRTNRAGGEILAALRALGVTASDEGRATLLDSPAVVGMVSLLELADDPNDRIAHFLVSRGPMRAVSGLAPLEQAGSSAAAVEGATDTATDPATNPPCEAPAQAAARFSSEVRREIADCGLAAVLRRFVDALHAECARAGTALSPRDASRLARVVAIAEEHDAKPVARLGEFIEALRADKADASSADRIRVMTIHKSKGLEFDEVVLHAANEPWGEAPEGWGALSTDPTRPPLLVAPIGNELMRRFVPPLRILERDERRRRLLDDISSFYVAITRARCGLHIIANLTQSLSYPTGVRLLQRVLARRPALESREGAAPEASSVQPSTVAELDTLASAPDFAASFGAAHAAAARGVLPRAEDPPFWECPHEGLEPEALAPRTAAATAGDARDATPVEHAAHRGAADTIVEVVPRAAGRAKPPSSHDAPALWAFDPFGDDDIALRGVLVHECFREIHSIETLLAAVAPDPKRLAELVQRAASRAAIEKGAPVSEALREGAHAMLVRLAAGAGTPGSIAESLRVGPRDEVRNEFPFLRETPTGAVTSGRIDRLVLHRDDDGRVVRATILDYKTGAVGKPAEQLAATLVGYQAQMRAYCGAVEELWSLEPGAARAELLFVDRGEVVPA